MAKGRVRFRLLERTAFVRGNEDPCKSTYSRIAFIERDLPDKRANSNEHEEQGSTAASGMGRRVHRQGAGHGAAQLTFDDEEAKDDREEEGGLHTGGARTHLACRERLRANPIQLQLLRRRCWHVGWRLLPCHQSLQQLC